MHLGVAGAVKVFQYNMNWFIRFWNWMSYDEGWKSLSGFIYLIICIFDFMIVPMWFGVMRNDINTISEYIKGLDTMVQLEYLKLLTSQHDPFTLQHGGIFHIAFGAILTGSVLSGNKKKE